MKNGPETAVLLAAGRGLRLRPFTDQVPKPLLQVDGRPVLDTVLAAAARAGIRQAILVTHHLSEQIESYVGDGSAWGLEAHFCRQPALDGTAGALKTAVEAFPEQFAPDRPFLLTATDYIFPPDYLADLVAAYRQGDADIWVSLKEMPPESLAGRSTVRFFPGGRIAEIIEKPRPDQIREPLAASLTFVLPGLLLDYLPRIEASPRGELEIQLLVNHMLADGYRAAGLLQAAPGEWEAPV